MVINEIVTNPRDVDWDGSGQPLQAQWLELYNTTGSTICLANWRITTADQAHPATLPAGQCMAPHGYLVIFKRDIGLNLGQGPVGLVDPNSSVVDSVSPPSLPTDQSFARMPDGSANWVVSTSPTLNGSNVPPPEPTATPDLQATVFAIQTQLALPAPSPPAAPILDDDSPDATDAADAARKPTRSRKGQAFQSLAIADIRDLADDSAVKTIGVITMPTGLWEPDRAYIQASGAGILIHSYGGTTLRLGDSLSITGRVHHVRGEVEIAAIKNGEQVAQGGGLPAPRAIAPGGIGSGTEALLVQMSGRVDGTERDYATIGDEAGSARVFLYGRLGFGPNVLKGTQAVTITGVVNAAESSAADSTGRTYAQRLLVSSHRLVPRLIGDIVVEGTTQVLAPPSSSVAAPDPSARARPPGERLASGAPLGSAAVGALPTAFVTPVLSSGGAVAVRSQATAGPNVLVLGAVTAAAELPWLWIVVGLGLASLLGGGAAVLAPRWLARRAQRPPDEE